MRTWRYSPKGPSNSMAPARLAVSMMAGARSKVPLRPPSLVATPSASQDQPAGQRGEHPGHHRVGDDGAGDGEELGSRPHHRPFGVGLHGGGDHRVGKARDRDGRARAAELGDPVVPTQARQDGPEEDHHHRRPGAGLRRGVPRGEEVLGDPLAQEGDEAAHEKGAQGVPDVVRLGPHRLHRRLELGPLEIPHPAPSPSRYRSPSTRKAIWMLALYSWISPSGPRLPVQLSTSTPVMFRTVLAASRHAFFTASSQLLGESPTSSITLTTATHSPSTMQCRG